MNLLKLANYEISSNKSNLKENFAVHAKYEAFYTGGRVQLSEDGLYLFCACGNKVQVLDSGTGKMVYSVRKDDDGDDVTAFTVDQKGEILVISYRSGLLRQWQWKTETVTRTWKSIHSGPIRCMVFDPTSAHLATGGSDSTVKVWDLNKQYCTHNLKGATGVFTVVQFYPESSRRHVFGAADDYKIHIWDLTTGRRVSILEGHFSAITQLAFTNNGKMLFSSGRDKVVLVWSLEKYTLQKTIPVYETLESVMLIPEGRLIPKLNVNTKDLHVLTAGNKGVLKVWNVNTGALVFTQEDALVSSSDSETSIIAMASYNATLDVVMVVTHEHNILMYRLEDFSKQKQLIGYNDDILDVRFFGEGDTHLVVATNSPIIKVFELATYNCQLLTGHTDLVLAVDVFSSKPSCMVSASKDNTVKFWSVITDTGEVSCLFTGRGHTHSVTAIACSSLGNGFLVSGSEDTTLKIWDVPEKAPLVIAYPSLAVRCTQRAHDKEINTVAIAPNDKLVVSGSQDKTAKVWQCDDLTLIGTVRGHRKGVWCVQFSPVDQVFATSSADGTVKIWALNNLSCVKTFEGHECSVMKLLFLSRGMQMLTGGSDGNVKLWNIKLNECTRTLDEHTDKVWAMAISKDEHFVVTGSADSKIFLWKDVTEEEKEKQHLELESVLEKDQELSNLIQQKKWLKALSLAITLDRPFKALNVIKEILIQQNGAEDMLQTIKQMRQDQIDSLLKFASTWNTNSKHCTAAQLVVRSVLTMFTPEKLMKFPTSRQFVEELLPYTERHMQRMNRLLQQASFVNYMWRTMKVASSNIQNIPATESGKDMGVDERINTYLDEICDIDANQKTSDKSSQVTKGHVTGMAKTSVKASTGVNITNSKSDPDNSEDSALRVSPINKSPVIRKMDTSINKSSGISKAETSKTKENPVRVFPVVTTPLKASTEMNVAESDSESDDNPEDAVPNVSPMNSSLGISKAETSKTKESSPRVFPIVKSNEMNAAESDSESEDNPDDSVPKVYSAINKSPGNSKAETSKTNESSLRVYPMVKTPVNASTEMNVENDSESDDNPEDAVPKVSPMNKSLGISKAETSKTKESPVRVFPVVTTPVKPSSDMNVAESDSESEDDVPKVSPMNKSPGISKAETSKTKESPLRVCSMVKTPVPAMNLAESGSDSDDNLEYSTLKISPINKSPVKPSPLKAFTMVKTPVKASTKINIRDSDSDGNSDDSGHKISPFPKSPVISKKDTLATKQSPLKLFPMVKTPSTEMNVTDSESDDLADSTLKMNPISKSPVMSKIETSKPKESPLKVFPVITSPVKAPTKMNISDGDSDSDDNLGLSHKISPVNQGPVMSETISSKTKESPLKVFPVVTTPVRTFSKMNVTDSGSDSNSEDASHKISPIKKSPVISKKVPVKGKETTKVDVMVTDSENDTIGDQSSPTTRSLRKAMEKNSPISKRLDRVATRTKASSARQCSSRVQDRESDDEGDTEEIAKEGDSKIEMDKNSPITKRPVRIVTRTKASRARQDSEQGHFAESENNKDSDNNAEVHCNTTPVRVTRRTSEKRLGTPRPQQKEASTAKKIPKNILTQSPAKRSNLRDNRYVQDQKTLTKVNSPTKKSPGKSCAKNLIAEDRIDNNDEVVKMQTTPAKKDLPNRKRLVRTCVKKVNDAKKRLTM